MAVCPTCGSQVGYANSGTCVVCRNFGCDSCLRVFGWAQVDSRPGSLPVAQRICSANCFNQWAWGHVQQGYALEVWGQYWSLRGTQLEPAFATLVDGVVAAHRRSLQLSHAEHLVEAERFEEAAKIYEKLKMWKEAGEIRRRSRRVVTTQVHVDVNHLIDQMRQGGLATTYSCPACRSPIAISGTTSPNSLQTCGYCGSAIQTTDLVEFLTRAVGYR
ncbi:MAG: hypothetical protein E6K17_05215 [Methanobacteriota archaeon]|nr:MAG: hypothetical protein E6K17_05215 [Euryarchaeota archaeon]